jgi:hypothetical protein
MTDPDPYLSRAASFLRDAPEPGWDAISDRVLAAVRATPRHGWPLQAAPLPDEVGTGALFVSDHALRAILARELRRRYLCLPTAITFTVDPHDDRLLSGVHLDITGSYGTELRLLGDQIRATVAQIVHDVLGANETNDSANRVQPIDVTITDIVTGDPLHPTER